MTIQKAIEELVELYTSTAELAQQGFKELQEEFVENENEDFLAAAGILLAIASTYEETISDLKDVISRFK